MPRPKSKDKRDAILSAAAKVFAGGGLDAPTSAISSAAGVANGTLFMYFATKDDLVNELYRNIKRRAVGAMVSGLNRKQLTMHDILRHAWENYLSWGVANPIEQKVLKQMQVWKGLTRESIEVGLAPLSELQEVTRAELEMRITRELPLEFLSAIICGLADITVEFMRENPKKAETYRNAGFEVLWHGVSPNR